MKDVLAEGWLEAQSPAQAQLAISMGNRLRAHEDDGQRTHCEPPNPVSANPIDLLATRPVYPTISTLISCHNVATVESCLTFASATYSLQLAAGTVYVVLISPPRARRNIPA